MPGHFRQVCALASEEFFHFSVSVCLATPKEVNVFFCHCCSTLPFSFKVFRFKVVLISFVRDNNVLIA